MESNALLNKHFLELIKTISSVGHQVSMNLILSLEVQCFLCHVGPLLFY